jgi:hypothetical protein
MNENPHIRAHKLSAKALVEGISSVEQTWLDQHVRECASCEKEIGSTHQLLNAMRAIPIHLPRDLGARTQLRVRLRAQTLEQPSSSFLLWVLTAASWLLGIFSAPLVWRGFTWAGSYLNVPKLALEMGFVLWWTIPALFAVGAVLYQKSQGARARGL